jgi:hypothetical protein
MDAKTRDLVLLGAVSLFLAGLITLFSARSFLRSAWSPLAAQPTGTGPDMGQLMLKRANASRPSGHRSSV